MQGALRHYDAAIGLSPPRLQHIPTCNRAAVYLEMGRYTEAVADCDAVLQEYPRHFKVRGVRWGCGRASPCAPAPDHCPAISAVVGLRGGGHGPEGGRPVGAEAQAQ